MNTVHGSFTATKTPQPEDHEIPTKKNKITPKAQSEDALDHSYFPLPAGMTSSNKSEGCLDVPLSSDILLGQGKPFQSHPGNQRMLQIIDGNKEQYSKAKHEKRLHLAEEVLDAILETGGRFLKQVEGEEYWEEVSHLVPLDKVSHAIRSKRQKTNAELP
jgi:hypothetical protein